MKTISTFLKEVQMRGVKFRLNRAGQIRTFTREHYCPLDAMADETNTWFKYKEPLGLSSDDAEAIILAADNDEACDQKLRAKLLKACGIKERV
jgi:hypothetical protein